MSPSKLQSKSAALTRVSDCPSGLSDACGGTLLARFLPEALAIIVLIATTSVIGKAAIASIAFSICL